MSDIVNLTTFYLPSHSIPFLCFCGQTRLSNSKVRNLQDIDNNRSGNGNNNPNISANESNAVVVVNGVENGHVGLHGSGMKGIVINRGGSAMNGSADFSGQIQTKTLTFSNRITADLSADIDVVIVGDSFFCSRIN